MPVVRLLKAVATLVLIGEACLQLKTAGNLDPTRPKHYNDVTIAAAARQIGATVITKNAKDFQIIQSVIDFEFEGLN